MSQHLTMRTGVSIAQPASPLHVTITEQDFTILMEGAGSGKAASTRDVCYGVASTAATAAVGVFATVPLRDGNNLIFWPTLAFLVLAVGTVGAFVVAMMARSRAIQDDARKSYRGVVERIEAEFRANPE